MKKLFLFATLALFALNVNAQDPVAVTSASDDDSSFGFAKGDIYISGAVGFSSSKFGESKSNGITVMPSLGFVVTDNIVVGAQVGYMTNKTEFDGDTTGETNTFMVGAYGKWLCNPDNRFTPYIGLGVNYMNEDDKQNEVKYTGIDIGAGAGLIYGLNEHFYLGANYAVLGYSTYKSDIDDAESQNTFTLGLDWKQLNFSLGYKF